MKRLIASLAMLFAPLGLFCLNIIVEGMPGAGKTSSLTSIISELPSEFILISETNPEPDSNWQNKPIDNQTDIYHEIWVERMDCIQTLSKNSDQIFLFDRSFFSNLAFKYAIDKISDTHTYEKYLRSFDADLKDIPIDLLIVLYVDAATSYTRKLGLKQPIPFPWHRADFLEALSIFYQEELPKRFSGPIVFINTSKMLPSEVRQSLLQQLTEYKKQEDKRTNFTHDEAIVNLLMTFAEKKNLGKAYSEVIEVFGYPTVYFQRHSVQLVDRTPMFLNNQRLRSVAQLYSGL